MGELEHTFLGQKHQGHTLGAGTGCFSHLAEARPALGPMAPTSLTAPHALRFPPPWPPFTLCPLPAMLFPAMRSETTSPHPLGARGCVRSKKMTSPQTAVLNQAAHPQASKPFSIFLRASHFQPLCPTAEHLACLRLPEEMNHSKSRSSPAPQHGDATAPGCRVPGPRACQEQAFRGLGREGPRHSLGLPQDCPTSRWPPSEPENLELESAPGCGRWGPGFKCTPSREGRAGLVSRQGQNGWGMLHHHSSRGRQVCPNPARPPGELTAGSPARQGGRGAVGQHSPHWAEDRAPMLSE